MATRNQPWQLPWPLYLKELKRGLALVLAAALFGLFYGVLFSEGLWFGLLNGILNGLFIAGLEVLWVRQKRGSRLRRLPFLHYVSALTAIWSLIILLNMTLTRHWLGLDHSLSLGWMLNLEFASHFLFSLTMAFLFNLMLRVNAFLGRRSMLDLLLGRYQEPVVQEKAFMVLDIADSTRMTEVLGDARAQRLIARYFNDLAGVVDHYGGEVHRFIGDQMVATWDLADHASVGRLLPCLEAVFRLQERTRGRYCQEFGLAPAFRVGLHGGTVLASEIGDSKRELAYFGDAINVAACLQQHCKVAGASVLISSSLLEQVELPVFFGAEALGPVSFKGKHRQVQVYRLSPWALSDTRFANEYGALQPAGSFPANLPSNQPNNQPNNQPVAAFKPSQGTACSACATQGDCISDFRD